MTYAHILKTIPAFLPFSYRSGTIGGCVGAIYYGYTVYSNESREKQIPTKHNPIIYHTSKVLCCWFVGGVCSIFWPLTLPYGALRYYQEEYHPENINKEVKQTPALTKEEAIKLNEIVKEQLQEEYR